MGHYFLDILYFLPCFETLLLDAVSINFSCKILVIHAIVVPPSRQVGQTKPVRVIQHSIRIVSVLAVHGEHPRP